MGSEMCIRDRHCSEPNRHIPWDDWPLQIPQENIPWKGDERFAGISAFGMSGTNVHLIVGQAPQTNISAVDEQGGVSAPAVATAGAIALDNPSQPGQTRSNSLPVEQLLTLSAQSPAALPELADRYATLLNNNPDTDISQLCFSAATGRSHLTHRTTFSAIDVQALTHSLTEFASGKTPVSYTHLTLPTILLV